MNNIALNPNLKNKVVVITGAGGILCSKMAEEFARQGAKVALLDININAIDKHVKKIISNNGNAIGVECDVLNIESIKKSITKVVEAFGEKIDVLINGAGGNTKKGTTQNEYFNKDDLTNDEINSFFNIDMDAFKFTFDLNIIGAIQVSQIYVRNMLHKGSSIINIGSVSSPTSLTKIPAYSAAKSGLTNFSRWLSVYLGKIEVRVNTIVPGFLLTDQNRSLLTNNDGSYTERTKKILKSTPFNRFGKPIELLGAVLFLSDNSLSSFISGTEIVIDGGFLAYCGV